MISLVVTAIANWFWCVDATEGPGHGHSRFIKILAAGVLGDGTKQTEASPLPSATAVVAINGPRLRWAVASTHHHQNQFAMADGGAQTGSGKRGAAANSVIDVDERGAEAGRRCVRKRREEKIEFKAEIAMAGSDYAEEFDQADEKLASFCLHLEAMAEAGDEIDQADEKLATFCLHLQAMAGTSGDDEIEQADESLAAFCLDLEAMASEAAAANAVASNANDDDMAAAAAAVDETKCKAAAALSTACCEAAGMAMIHHGHDGLATSSNAAPANEEVARSVRLAAQTSGCPGTTGAIPVRTQRRRCQQRRGGGSILGVATNEDDKEAARRGATTDDDEAVHRDHWICLCLPCDGRICRRRCRDGWIRAAASIRS
uniref:Uncharacterized protein n=1 Tax=Oryza sativa subsp. japonica TaxID=39947 RepID=Q6ZBN1_ORYSJ|nr:hypothetical protein [Oryza sativa Japonica Group]